MNLMFSFVELLSSHYQLFPKAKSQVFSPFLICVSLMMYPCKHPVKGKLSFLTTAVDVFSSSLVSIEEIMSKVGCLG